MKLLRLGPKGAERPAVLDADGQARDVSSLVSDFGPGTLPSLGAVLAGADLAALPAIDMENTRIGAPIARPHNVWCIGLNYSDHAAEAGMPIPAEPILFTKPSSTVCGPFDPVPKAAHSSKLDWEVELGVVIGKPALEITEVEAMDHVAGYCTVNDISEREWQLDRGGQWSKGKGYPNFCPTGPWLVTPDEIADPGALSMQMKVNGAVMQSGSTETMIFGVARIISYLSQFCLLEPGDLICTGTPPGVGMGQTPPRYLDPGDRMELFIHGLGRQAQQVIPAEEFSWI